MTGFSLGETTGATLGTTNGGTLGTTSDVWVIGGHPLPGQFDETATYRSLTLSFRLQTEALLDRARSLKTNDNQISVLTTDNGGFTAVDRAGGANTYQVDPPTDREPLRQPGTHHVARYEEELVGQQDVSEWNVELELIRNADRTDRPSISATEQVPVGNGDGFTLGTTDGATLGTSDGGTLGSPNGDERPRDWWGLGTRYGDILTQRVDGEFLGTGADGVPRFELMTRLTFQQAHVFEAALAKVDGQRVRQIPDGDNVAVDETGGDVTLDVTSPTPDVVASGDYTVTEWQSERISDVYQEVSVKIAETQ